MDITKAVRIVVFSLAVWLFALLPAPGMAQEKVSKDVYQRVLKGHNAYFQLREMGRYETAYDMLTERQKAIVSLADFSAQWTGLRKNYGKLTVLDNRKVTWYRNPEGLPEGLYAAIDFRASFEHIPVFCGYLVWSVDEGYKLQREELNFLKDSSNRLLSQAEREKAFQQLSCR